MKRSKAARLLEEIREALSEHVKDPTLAVHDIRRALSEAGVEPLTPCPGEAHTAGGWIDNCSVCAPRWGWIGDKIKIS